MTILCGAEGVNRALCSVRDLIRVAALVLPLAACSWRGVGPEARPRMGLEAVDRSSAEGAPSGELRPATEPGRRGYFFADSLIALRSRADLASIRVRVWNRSREPIRLIWEQQGPGPHGWQPARACPDTVTAWAVRRSGPPRAPDVVEPGAAREGSATPVARVRTLGGDAWQAVSLQCVVYDPAEPRMALRLWVETGGVRHVYTLWYRLLEPPRADGGGDPAPP